MWGLNSLNLTRGFCNQPFTFAHSMLASHWQGSGLECGAGRRPRIGRKRFCCEREHNRELQRLRSLKREEWKLRSEIFFRGISAISAAGFGPARALQNTRMWKHVCTNAQDYPHPAVITSHLMLCSWLLASSLSVCVSAVRWRSPIQKYQITSLSSPPILLHFLQPWRRSWGSSSQR